MISTPVEGHLIPENVQQRLSGLTPVDAAVPLSPVPPFSAYLFHHRFRQSVQVPAFRLPCSGSPCDLSEHEFLTRDGVIVGIRIRSSDIYCYENPVGCPRHFKGRRTSSACWYFDEDHGRYTFFLADEHP